MPKIRLEFPWLFVFVMITQLLHAHDTASWTDKYGLRDIPPTTTGLVKEEREARDHESLKNIEDIVTRVVHHDDEALRPAKRKKHKRRQGRRHASHAKSAEKKINHGAKEHGEELALDVIHLLEGQYNDPELIKKKVSLNLKKVDFREAIELMSNLAGVKFIMDADVEGIVRNFSFKNISLAAAFNILLNNNVPRLALLKMFGVWRIVRRSVAIDFLKLSVAQLREQDTSLVSVTMYHATWDESFKTRLEKLWQGIVGTEASKNGHYLMFDDNSKKLFFRGRKNHVHDFKRCLEEVDVEIPQVRIDARVIIAEKDFEEAIGFEWSGIYDRRASIKHFDFAGVGIADTTNSKTNFGKLLNWSLNFIPTNVSNGFNLNLPLVFGNKTLETKRLNLLLQAAENKSEIKTILKPSMLIKSDEMAEILVGNEMPQEVRLQETVAGQPTNISTISYKDIGMKIKVKPVVSPDHNAVFLDIFVENSAITKAPVVGEGAAINPQSPSSTFNYTIRTSRSRNRVLLKSGQTTLISGLMINSQEKAKSGVPLLQEIPILGWFFSGSRKVLIDKQLLIFITPTLV